MTLRERSLTTSTTASRSSCPINALGIPRLRGLAAMTLRSPHSRPASMMPISGKEMLFY
jgi:hypothetical protein